MPSNMTPEELRAIRERAERATPGPWGGYHLGLKTAGGRLGYQGYGRQVQLWKLGPNGPLVWDGVCVCEVGLDDNDEANADFIAHAREDIPALLAEIERLQAKVLWCKVAMDSQALAFHAQDEVCDERQSQ